VIIENINGNDINGLFVNKVGWIGRSKDNEHKINTSAPPNCPALYKRYPNMPIITAQINE